MKIKFIAPFLILALVLSGCSVIGKTVGMVPEADLIAANELVAISQANLDNIQVDLDGYEEALDAANNKVADLQEQVDDLVDANKTIFERNEDLESLICSDHDWNDFFVSGSWRPEGWFDLSYSEALITLQNEWGFIPQMTQWTGLNEYWQDNLLGYIIIWDGQSMVWNVDMHCLIMDPKVYRDLGR